MGKMTNLKPRKTHMESSREVQWNIPIETNFTNAYWTHNWNQMKMMFVLLRVLLCYSWWRHQMEPFSALLALCAGNSPVPVTSPHKDQWRGALVFSLICAWINDWVNNREADDLRRHRGHYDVNVMIDPNRSHICIPVAAVELSWYVSNCDPVKSDKYVYNSMITSPSIVCMMTSSNGNIFRVTGPLCGEFTGHRWIPLAKASDTELWCYLWLSWGWLYETPSCPLWLHCNGETGPWKHDPIFINCLQSVCKLGCLIGKHINAISSFNLCFFLLW